MTRWEPVLDSGEMPPVFVLMHSPLVGPATWRPVARELRSRGIDTLTPSLVDMGTGGEPYWPRVVSAVAAAVSDAAAGRELVLVAHSNAGLFVPMTNAGLTHRIRATVFADASLPAPTGETPVVPGEILGFLRGLADEDGLLPRWTDWFGAEETAALFPDEATRREVTAELPRLPLSYFEENVPVPEGWDESGCGYLQFSAAYDGSAGLAAERGWPVERLPGGHLHQLIDPEAVADAVLRLGDSR
ncbi:MAG: alpha/beta fold hydrolase [Stackebrandtia sp.]